MKNISLERLAFILANTKNNLEIYVISQIVANMSDDEYKKLKFYSGPTPIQSVVYSYAFWHNFDHLIADGQISETNLLVRAILYREGISRDLCNNVTTGIIIGDSGIGDLIDDAKLCPDEIVHDILRYKESGMHTDPLSVYQYKGVIE